jgi:hypothetical protein
MPAASKPATSTTPTTDALAAEAAEPAKATGTPDYRKYVEYRLSKLNAPIHGGRLGGAAGVNAHSVRVILNELLELADWLEKGSPTPVQSLNETDKEFYRNARARGLDIPAEIEAQL